MTNFRKFLIMLITCQKVVPPNPTYESVTTLFAYVENIDLFYSLSHYALIHWLHSAEKIALQLL